jgi:hypothetical protein
MPADLVIRIAGEFEKNRAYREQLTKQLDVLMKGSDTYKRFIGVRLLGKTGTWCAPFSVVAHLQDRCG